MCAFYLYAGAFVRRQNKKETQNNTSRVLSLRADGGRLGLEQAARVG